MSPSRPQLNANNCPRLIEVALPIREISAESVRQKNPQRRHIPTRHLWWARRPLAASLLRRRRNPARGGSPWGPADRQRLQSHWLPEPAVRTA